MNPFEQMELKKSTFTKNELIVYEVLTNNIDDILRDSATQLAEKYNISQSAISRFCQKLGYAGFNDFKYDIYKQSKLNQTIHSPTNVIEYYSKLIHQIPNAVSDEVFQDIAKIIIEARYVSINGYHKSAIASNLLEMNLAKFNILASAVAYDRAHTLSDTLTEKDVVIFFSATSNVYVNIIDMINEKEASKRPKTILITMNDKHAIRNKVDKVVWLPNYKNQGYPQYLESQVVFMVFIDLLTSYIAHLLHNKENTI